MKRTVATLLALLLALVFAASLASAAERRTRDLIFEEDEELVQGAQEAGIEDPEVVAIRTSLELTRDGETKMVLPTYEFQSGDKVKFVYTTNIDSYVYWLAEGTTGSYSMIFPHPKIEQENFVKKNEKNTFPVDGSFRFDENPGTEKILVVMSPQPIPELEEAAQGGDATPSAEAVTEKNESKRKSRDLVFEEEADEESGIATKSQAASDLEEPFVAYFELVHK
jgi:hypothetical protein